MVSAHMDMVTLIPKLPLSANSWAMLVSNTRQSEFMMAELTWGSKSRNSSGNSSRSNRSSRSSPPHVWSEVWPPTSASAGDRLALI